jgi:hypothetical protein
VSSWLSGVIGRLLVGCFKVGYNVLGAEAVSEFTAKSLFKERLQSFSPKTLFEVQNRLLPLPTVMSGQEPANSK